MNPKFQFAAETEKPVADRRGQLTGIGRAATIPVGGLCRPRSRQVFPASHPESRRGGPELSIAQAFAAGLGDVWTLERICVECRKLEAGR